MADFKNRGFQVSCDWRRTGHVLTSDWLQLLPSKLPPGGQQGNTAWSARYKSSEALPNLEGSSITAIKKENNVKNKRQVDLLSWIYFHILSRTISKYSAEFKKNIYIIRIYILFVFPSILMN